MKLREQATLAAEETVMMRIDLKLTVKMTVVKSVMAMASIQSDEAVPASQAPSAKLMRPVWEAIRQRPGRALRRCRMAMERAFGPEAVRSQPLKRVATISPGKEREAWIKGQ